MANMAESKPNYLRADASLDGSHPDSRFHSAAHAGRLEWESRIGGGAFMRRLHYLDDSGFRSRAHMVSRWSESRIQKALSTGYVLRA
jgi:hypothetical protein